jgi:FkbM family methyltransferase
MGGSIYWTGFHHVNEILYLNRILTSEMTFVDIGANQGEFSLFAASKLTHGKVISFEPVSYQLGLLKDNVNLNNFTNITIHPIGLSDQKSSLPIYTSSESSLHSGVHEGLSTLYATESRNEFQEEIRLEIFDEIYEDTLTRLDFIKIDIEGAELFALKGMHKHIEKFKPQILIELSEETFEAAGYTVKDMLDFLGSFGYKAYRINRGKLIECPTIHTEWGNYIFKVQ